MPPKEEVDSPTSVSEEDKAEDAVEIVECVSAPWQRRILKKEAELVPEPHFAVGVKLAIVPRARIITSRTSSLSSETLSAQPSAPTILIAV